jgi:ankyrin repeat protein
MKTLLRLVAILVGLPLGLYAQIDLPTAVQAGDTIDIEKVLDRGVDINQKFEKGNSALIYACIKGDTHVMGYLLRHGAKINFQNDEGFTPLMTACMNNKPDAVKYLLTHKASKSMKNKNKSTALNVAADTG